ncbi:MAG TPA: MFS transporter, partial [Acidimicrobiia bacterium]|nr:MFS transporter [Acidimicrobiia bacterium]
VVHLQTDLGYSALYAGASLLPLTILMFLFSARAGALAQRIGPRIPMTVGPLVVAAGLALLGQIRAGDSYLGAVFPGVVVLGIGLTITVAPLTAAVLAAAEERHAGIASAINNAVARLASLLAIAVVPAVAGMTGTAKDAFASGYPTALRIAAIVAAAGGAIAFATIRRGATVTSVTQPDVAHACQPAACLENASG